MPTFLLFLKCVYVHQDVSTTAADADKDNTMSNDGGPLLFVEDWFKFEKLSPFDSGPWLLVEDWFGEDESASTKVQS